MLLSAGGLATGFAFNESTAAAPDGAARPLLRADEPAALALAYVESSAKVDAKANPTWRRGQSCATCALIEFGTGRARGCSAVPGKLVLATGWCRAWRLRGA
jgi:hypothetical protein